MSNIKNIALPDGKIYGIREDLVPDYSFNTIQEMNEAINDGDVENDATIYVKERTAYPIPSYTSGDTDLAPTSSVNVPLMTSNESQESLWTKVSNMFKNIRYLIKMLGTTDISAVGDGTLTGAIDELNSDLSTKMDAGIFYVTKGVQRVKFSWDGTGLQIICRLTDTVLVGLNINSTSISYIQSKDNETTWNTVWTK